MKQHVREYWVMIDGVELRGRFDTKREAESHARGVFKTLPKDAGITIQEWKFVKTTKLRRSNEETTKNFRGVR